MKQETSIPILFNAEMRQRQLANDRRDHAIDMRNKRREIIALVRKVKI